MNSAPAARASTGHALMPRASKPLDARAMRIRSTSLFTTLT